MSRFVFSLPQVAIPAATLTTPGLITPGAGLVINPTTGRVDVDGLAPAMLSGAALSTDVAIVLRNIGTDAAPNWVPYYATQAAIKAWAAP